LTNDQLYSTLPVPPIPHLPAMTPFPLEEFTQQDYLQQGFQSTVPESSNRRQRISMACQYCRHR
jgi:hypothetical protein